MGADWVTISEARTLIDNMLANGFTNYDDALGTAIAAYADPGKLAAGINRSIFITDGAPNRGNGDNTTLTGTINNTAADNGIQAAEETIWTTFLEANDISSQALSIDAAAGLTEINPIAYNGETNTNTDGEVVTPANLEQAILNGVNVGIFSSSLLGGELSSTGGLGADGGSVVEFTLDGNTYNFDVTTGVLTTTAPVSLWSFDSGTNVIDVTTTQGGLFTLDFDDAIYTYQASDTVLSEYSETIVYTSEDADGDRLEGAVLTLDVSLFSATIDNLITNQIGSTIVIDSDALLGNDNTFGGAVVDNVSDAIGGTVTGTSSISFATGLDPLGTTYTVIAETAAANDTGATAQVLDRGDFGDATAAPDAANVPNLTDSNVQVTGALSANADDDYYEISLAAGETLTVDIDNTTGGLDSFVRLYSDVATTIEVAASDDNSSDTGSGGSIRDSLFSYTATEAGTYYIQVDSFSNSSSGNYEMWVGIDDTDATFGSFGYTISENGISDFASVNITQVDTGATVTGTVEDNTLVGRDGADDTLNGLAGNDVLFGGSGNDILAGGADNDVLLGGDGDDDLQGNANDDRLDGGAGDDELRGGNGDDVLIYDAMDSIINGQNDTDTLVITDTSTPIDWSNVTNIEIIDITDSGVQNLTITEADVLAVTDAGNTLEINGDSGDTVTLSGFTQGAGSGGYTAYTSGTATVNVLNDLVNVGNVII